MAWTTEGPVYADRVGGRLTYRDWDEWELADQRQQFNKARKLLSLLVRMRDCALRAGYREAWLELNPRSGFFPRTCT